MWQLQQALATAAAAVLVSASGAARSLARPPPSAGEGCGAPAAAAAEPRSHHLPYSQAPAAEGAVQLAVAAVLYNTQRHAPLLLAACTAAIGRGTRLAADHTVEAPGPTQQEGTGALGRVRSVGEAAAAAAGDPAAGRGKHEELQELQDREGCGLTAGPAAGVPRRAGERWSREQLEVLVLHAKGLPPTGPLAAREALSKLGLSGTDESKALLLASVRNKLCYVRQQLAHGRDPLEAKPIQRAKPNTYNWRAWLAQAYQALPDREGTVDDAAAIIEADPVISKLLDRRPDPRKRDAPRWRMSLVESRDKYPEFEDTGRKRRRQRIFRYNEQVVDELAARKKATVPRHSLPHLGKGQ